MALLRMIGWDGVDISQQANLWDVDYTGWNFPNMVVGRYGGLGYEISNTGGSHATFVVTTANLVTGIIGGDVRPDSGFNGLPFYCFNDAGSPQVRITMDATGHIKAYRGGTLTVGSLGTLLGTSTLTLTASAWAHIEAKVTINSSTGSVLVKVEGVTFLNLTGVNTQATGNTFFNEMGITHTDSGTGARDFDNWYCMDTSGPAPYNDMIGPSKIDMHVPTVNGTTISWTGLSLPNSSQVNDFPGGGPGWPVTPDNDTTYISSPPSGSDLIDTYPVAGFTELGDNNSIQVSAWARADAGSGGRQLKLVIYLYGVTYQGTPTFNISGTTYRNFSDISFAGLDPLSNPWTVERLNNCQFGVVNVGNGVMDGVNIRVTEINVERLSQVTQSQHLFVPNHPISC